MIVLNEFRVVSERIISEAETFIQPSIWNCEYIKGKPLINNDIATRNRSKFPKEKEYF
ncbi:MAG: hypothetical protein ACSHW7_00730 [Patiriisocius sp.]|uniref:hypothetical protein n=1 Tax=Patiriisocius sp. TaxID=2822396 RepID=UPI003EF124F8